MRPLKYGLVGCGMMGVEHIANVALLETVEIAVLYDPEPTMARKAAALCPGAHMAASFEELIGFEELDAIIISSPNHLHASQLIEISEQRTLPILCEKPLYTRPEDAARLMQLQASYGAPIWVAMEYRYMPALTQFLEQAEAATGGIEMLTIREHRQPFLQKVGNWNRFNVNTGGTLVEKCCHFFDLMRLALKSEPVRVMASAGQAVNHLNEIYEGERSDIWDSGYMIFDFASGARAMLELCMFADGTHWNEEITAVGAAGKIECKIPGPQRFWPEGLGPSPEAELILSPRHPKRPVRTTVEVDPRLLAAGDHNGSTFFQHQKFAAIIRNGGLPEVTLKDGSRAVEMGQAAQLAASEHRVVELS